MAQKYPFSKSAGRAFHMHCAPNKRTAEKRSHLKRKAARSERHYVKKELKAGREPNQRPPEVNDWSVY